MFGKYTVRHMDPHMGLTSEGSTASEARSRVRPREACKDDVIFGHPLLVAFRGWPPCHLNLQII